MSWLPPTSTSRSAAGASAVGRGVACVWLLCGLAHAQVVGPPPPTPPVSGIVADGETMAPIAGATVRSGDRRTATDGDGRFALALAAGNQTLVVAAAGYLETSIPLRVGADGYPPLEVVLFSETVLSQTVEVRGTIPRPAGPSATPVAPAQVLEAAGSIDNIFRTLDTLPGVSAAEDFGSRLSVRGGAPDQNLTLMDGVEIHNPFRLFGIASAFNPETIERFDLTAGGFSSRYGDRLSSLLTIETRDGRPGFGGSVTTSLTDANVVLEGSMPGPGSGAYLFTARRTYYDVIADRVSDQDFPSFGDVQLKTSWTFGPGHRLAVWGLGSREGSDFEVEDDARPEDRGRLVSDTRNDILAARLDALFGTRTTSRTVVSWYRNRELLDFNGSFRDDATRSNAPGDDVAFGQADIAFARELAVRDVALRQELAVVVSDRHEVNVGAELHRLRTGIGFRTRGSRNVTEANGSSVRGGVGLPDAVDSPLSGTRGGLWVEDRYRPSARLTLTPGVRLEWSTVNGRRALLPRLSARFELAPRWRLRGAVGQFAQSPGYEKLIQADYFLDLTRARALGIGHERALHVIVGVERDLGDDASARVEGYYKRFDDLIIGRLETDAERATRLARYDFPAALRGDLPAERVITSQPTNGGAGRAYGMDVFVSRSHPADRLTGWLSYTFGKAEQDAYGQRYPFDYDRRHAFNLVGRYRFTDRFDLGLTARLASGFTRTDVVGLRVAATEDDRGRLVPEVDAEGNLVYTVDFGGVANLNRGRLPPYARLDVRGTYRPGGLTGRWSVYVEVINLLNRDNPVELSPELAHDPSGMMPRVVDVPAAGFPLLPTFGLRVRF